MDEHQRFFLIELQTLRELVLSALYNTETKYLTLNLYFVFLRFLNYFSYKQILYEYMKKPVKQWKRWNARKTDNTEQL